MLLHYYFTPSYAADPVAFLLGVLCSLCVGWVAGLCLGLSSLLCYRNIPYPAALSWRKACQEKNSPSPALPGSEDWPDLAESVQVIYQSVTRQAGGAGEVPTWSLFGKVESILFRKANQPVKINTAKELLTKPPPTVAFFSFFFCLLVVVTWSNPFGGLYIG